MSENDLWNLKKAPFCLLICLILGNGKASGLCFGHIWRDSYVLVIVTQAGELIIKRVKRGAEFTPQKISGGEWYRDC